MLADLDVVVLSRIQFALTIIFHYLFPPLTIGLGIIIAYLEGMSLWKKDRSYMDAARFWTGIFGINFALGVATRIVMEFEFGTNWATSVGIPWRLACWRSPPLLTLSNAASSQGTLWIMTIIALIGDPFILSYTAVIYWTFRRPIDIEDG